MVVESILLLVVPMVLAILLLDEVKIASSSSLVAVVVLTVLGMVEREGMFEREGMENVGNSNYLYCYCYGDVQSLPPKKKMDEAECLRNRGKSGKMKMWRFYRWGWLSE